VNQKNHKRYVLAIHIATMNKYRDMILQYIGNITIQVTQRTFGIVGSEVWHSVSNRPASIVNDYS